MQALGFFFILHRLHSLHYHAASWELVFGTPRFFRMPTHSYSASPRPTRGGRTWRTSLAKSDGSRGAVRWPEQSRSARSNMQSVVKHSPATSTHLGTVGRVRPAGVGVGAGSGLRLTSAARAPGGAPGGSRRGTHTGRRGGERRVVSRRATRRGEARDERAAWCGRAWHGRRGSLPSRHRVDMRVLLLGERLHEGVSHQGGGVGRRRRRWA